VLSNDERLWFAAEVMRFVRRAQGMMHDERAWFLERIAPIIENVESAVLAKQAARSCCECNAPIAPNDWDRRTIADGDGDAEQIAFLMEAIDVGLEQHGANLAARIADLEARLQSAEDALHRKGYRRSCDIPACNCGDQWTHGGHASERLRELSEELGELTQGTTILGAVKDIKARLAAAEEDGRRLDWIADERMFEGLGGEDFDILTLEAMQAAGADGDDEDAWRMEWRKQMRAALDRAAIAAAGKEGDDD
jgi:hypothetical protein